MSLTVSTLRSWRPQAVAEAAADLRAAVRALSTQHDQLTTQFGRLGVVWTGGAARSGQVHGAGRRQSLAATADALGACAIVLSAAAEALTEAQRELEAAAAITQGSGLVLNDDGSVTIPATVLQTTGGENVVSRLDRSAQVGTTLARRALANAAAADGRAARGLTHAAELATKARTMGLDIAGAMAANAQGAALRALIEADLLPDIRLQPIPAHVRRDPTAAAQWWAALSADQKALQIRANAKTIGSLDGLPMSARDPANRIVLATELAQARAEYARLLAQAGAQPPLSPSTRQSAPVGATAMAALQAKIAMLQSVQTQLAGHPERRLMLLDTAVPGRAAIAIGDVDRARHVAFVVPGLEQDVTQDMGRIVGNADRLQQQMDELSRASGAESTATVAWLGYHTPGFDNVAVDSSAQAGAGYLRGSLAGLDASRAATTGPGHPPLHLTLVGHSYGSLTAGIAMRDSSPVDDLVIIGSPGVGVNTAAALHGVPPGHVYVGEADGDRVADVRRFGADPNHESFGAHVFSTRPAVDPSTGVATTASEGHSAYFDRHTTSLRSIALVALGRPERVTYSDLHTPAHPRNGGDSW